MRVGGSHGKISPVKARQIAPLALILLGAVGCTSGGAGGSTSSAPESSVGVSTTALNSPAPSSPTAVTSPSPTPTVATTGPNVRPGEKPPTLTAGAKTNSRSGALQFSIIWVRALDWGYATTDSTLARSLFAPSCSECDRFSAIFDRAKSAGQHFRGGRLTYESSTLVSDDNQHSGSTPVDVIFSQQALSVVTAENRLVDSEPRQSNVRYREWLSRTGPSGWSLIDFKQVVTSK